MTGLLIFIHTIICIFLVVVILMQSGRGGGLTEGFAAAESMFGAKTNVVLIKTTTVLASIFLVTSMSLAYLSSQKNKSLIEGSAGRQKTMAPLSTQVNAQSVVPLTDENVKKENVLPSEPVAQPSAGTNENTAQ